MKTALRQGNTWISLSLLVISTLPGCTTSDAGSEAVPGRPGDVIHVETSKLEGFSNAGGFSITQPVDTPLADGSASATTDGVIVSDINTVTCGTRTDWFRLWTALHGFPKCYANNGTVFYGDRPPDTTWTSYGFCAGNNSGTVTYAVPGFAGWVQESFGSPPGLVGDGIVQIAS